MTGEIQVMIPFRPPEEYLPTKKQVESLSERFKQKPTPIPLSFEYEPERTIIIREKDNTTILVLGLLGVGLLGFFGLLAFLGSKK